MKRSVRFISLLLSLILIISLIVGCGAKGKDPSNEISPHSTESKADYGAGETAPSQDDFDAEKAIEDGKIITTMYLSFETKEFDKTNENLNKLMKKHKAYIENSDISYDQYYNGKKYRSGEFSIRVPRKNLAQFKNDLNGIGNLISESTNKEDVIKLYRDTESRLRVITTKEERILSLLKKADKMEDIIALENQLTDIIYDKERLQSELLNIDDKVDYSTVVIHIREVEMLSDQETIETKFLTRIKRAFKNSFYGFIKSLQDFLIWFIYFLPFAIILGIIVYMAYRLLKKIRKNKS